MCGDHDEIGAFHRAGEISPAHNREVDAVADHRLNQLRAALHGDDFNVQPIFFQQSFIFGGPHGCKFSAETRDTDPDGFSEGYFFYEKQAYP